MPAKKSPAHRLGVIDKMLRRAAREPGFHLTKRRLLEEVNQDLMDRGHAKGIGERMLDYDLDQIKAIPHVKVVEEYRVVAVGGEADEGFNSPTSLRKCLRYEDRGMSISSSVHLNMEEADRVNLEACFKLMYGYSDWQGFDCVYDYVPELETLFLGKTRKGNPHILVDHSQYLGRDRFRVMNQAIVERQVLWVCYQPFEQEERSFRFHPHVIMRFNGRLFCVGYNETEGYWKQVLALDRIIEEPREVKRGELSASENEEDWFYRDQEFGEGESWHSHFKHVLGSTVNDAPVEDIVIRFKGKRAHYVHTKPLHPGQWPRSRMPEPDADDWYEFKYKLIPNNEFYAAVLAFGPDAEVVSPASVRDHMIERVRGMSAAYLG